MKLLVALTSLSAIALGAALLLPPQAEGYAIAGTALGTAQRDLRLFNQFLDPTANDNTTADPNFPGYDGAELAVWKAATEWASGLHAGSGNGDPTQPGGLGSGGANMDYSWQGNATAAGGNNDNIISVQNIDQGSTLAVTLLPNGDGWKMIFYDLNWTWNDGPGAVGGNEDLQSVACHELGHALGLGHSADTAATMYFAYSGGTGSRSINADDSAGTQFLYSAKSATKPTITSVANAAGTLTITGTNFTATGNEVWFTQKTAGGTGNPVKVTNVSSTGGGTQIVVTAPASAGKGDLLVKKSGGTNGTFLSNAWPVDPGTTGAVSITAITPSPIDVISAEMPQVVVLNGSGLSSVTSLSVAGSPLAGTAWTVNSDTQITISGWPLLNALGDVDVTVSGLSGSDTAQVTVNACDPPVLDVNPSVPFPGLNGFPVTMTASSEPGDVVFFLFSTTNAPSTFPGMIDIGLGGGLSSYGVFTTAVIPPKGWVQVGFTPTTIPPGTSVFMDAVAFPSEDPNWLVEDSDPPQQTVYLF